MTRHGLFLCGSTCAGSRIYTLDIHIDLCDRIVTQFRIIDTRNATIAVSGCTGIGLLLHGAIETAICDFTLIFLIVLIQTHGSTIHSDNSAQILISGKILKGQPHCCNPRYGSCIRADCSSNSQTALIRPDLRHIFQCTASCCRSCRRSNQTGIFSDDSSKNSCITAQYHCILRNTVCDRSAVCRSNRTTGTYSQTVNFHTSGATVSFHFAVLDRSGIHCHNSTSVSITASDISIVCTVLDSSPCIRIFRHDSTGISGICADTVTAVHRITDHSICCTGNSSDRSMRSLYFFRFCSNICIIFRPIKSAMIDTDNSADFLIALYGHFIRNSHDLSVCVCHSAKLNGSAGLVNTNHTSDTGSSHAGNRTAGRSAVF